MQRRHFIKNLVALYGISILPDMPVLQFQKIYLLQFFIRGFRFYKGVEMIDQISHDGLVELVREPDNQYDENAIAIHYNGIKIGYVPQEDNLILARLLDARLLDLQAEITHINKKVADWEKIRVAVYALKEAGNDVPKDLLKIETPHYVTLKSGKEHYTRLYFEDETLEDETAYLSYEMDSDEIISDILNDNKALQQMIDDQVFVIKKTPDNNEIIEHFSEKINQNIIELKNILEEDTGYVVADIHKILKQPDVMTDFVERIDNNGHKIIEILLNKT